MPGRRPGECVSELMSGGGDRRLSCGEADRRCLTFDTSGARRAGIAAGRDHTYGGSRPPRSCDDSFDRRRNLCKRPHRFEVGSFECRSFRGVDLGAPRIHVHPVPNDRRPCNRWRPRSARSAAALPALHAPTSAPAEPLAVRTRPKRCWRNSSTRRPRSSRTSERPASSTVTSTVDVDSVARRTSSSDFATRSA